MSDKPVPALPTSHHAQDELNSGSMSALAATIAGMMLGPGPLIVGGFSLLVTAIAHDMGWSRTTFSLMAPIMAWTSAATAPFYGRLMDRYGLRRVMIPVIAALGLSFGGAGLFTHATWQFFLAYFLVGAAAGALGPVGYNKLLSQWFTTNRGLAMALCAAAGSGMGYALAPQIVNGLIKAHGWRAAYVGISLLILCISLPMAFFFMRERVAPDPEEALNVREVASQSSAREGLTFREGAKTSTLWLLVAILFLPGNAYYGILIHFVPIVTDRGIGRDVAATALSFVALGAIGGQLAASALLDRVHSARVALPFLVCGMLGLLLIQGAHTTSAFIVAAVFIGIGQGSENSVVAYMTSRLLGLKSFGVFFGIIFGSLTFAAGSAPLLMGYVFDKTGSYQPVLIGFDGAFLVAIAAVFFLPGYAYGRTPTAAQQPAIPQDEKLAPR
jgi:MFS family permease